MVGFRIAKLSVIISPLLLLLMYIPPVSIVGIFVFYSILNFVIHLVTHLCWWMTVGWSWCVGLVNLAAFWSSCSLYGERCPRLRHRNIHPVGSRSVDDRHRISWLLRSIAWKPMFAWNRKCQMSFQKKKNTWKKRHLITYLARSSLSS